MKLIKSGLLFNTGFNKLTLNFIKYKMGISYLRHITILSDITIKQMSYRR